MPKIINAFSGQSPIAEALANFGTSMFGDTLTPELRRQQLYDLQKNSTEEMNFARDYMADPEAAMISPQSLGSAFLSGRKPADIFGIHQGFTANKYGAEDPRFTNAAQGAGMAASSTMQGFQADQGRQERQHGATIDENARQFDKKPIEAWGTTGPQFIPQDELVSSGARPMATDSQAKGGLALSNFDRMGELTPEQSRYLDIDANKAPATKNYIARNPDGSIKTFMVNDISLASNTDIHGQPLPPNGYIGTVQGGADEVGLTNSLQTATQQVIMSANAFSSQADALIELATKNPASFGIVGAGRNAAQEISETVRVLGDHFGFNPQDLAQKAEAVGFDAGGYDESLPQAKLLGTSIVYQAAASIAGQQNRSISDIDKQAWQEAMGYVQSFWAFDTSKSIITKTRFAKAVVQEHARLAKGLLEQGYKFDPNGSDPLLSNAIARVMAKPQEWAPAQPQNNRTGVPTPTPVQTTTIPAPVAPGAAPVAPMNTANPPVESHVGQSVPIMQSPQDAARLKPGTVFQTPDGRYKVAP
jgi:hypothetical protein